MNKSPSGKPGAVQFAIHELSSPASMTWTISSLQRYLYGYDYEQKRQADGKLVATPIKIDWHVLGAKKVEAGFFRLPDSEQVSAVLFSNSGTISKFARMGALAGFGSDSVQIVREGAWMDPDPNVTAPRYLKQNVRGPRYAESWAEGISIFHNPNAIKPLDPTLLPGVAHHWFAADGNLHSAIPEDFPLASLTHLLVREEAEAPEQAS